jgi:DDE superfamily endonuclease
VFWLLEDKANFHGEEVVEFLRQLRRRMPRFTVIWDRNQIHGRSKAVKAYLAQHPEVVAEDLPGYAPECNPDELVWCWVKYGRLCNYAAPDTKALRGSVEAELGTLQEQAYELLDFLDYTGLSLAA